MSARASAVIVNYNARDHLVECLRSLRSDGVDEVVVIDNGSRDGSAAAVARADPQAAFMSTGSNLGFGTAANRGVAATDTEFVMILNPDAIVEPGATKMLVDALDTQPALAVVGPRVENPDGTLYPSARRFPDLVVAIGHAFGGFVRPDNRFTRNYKMLDQDRTQSSDVDWVSGTCMLARRSAFDQVGGFDESYFMYVEDVDLCWRLSEAGWKIGYEPRARVVHTIGASSELAPYRMIAAHHLSLLRFATKTTTGRRRALLPAVAVGLVARTVLAWLQRAYRGRPHAAE
ncbi:MAG: glycosyltransferase family 2 protein [Actinomycetota bacterium]|nr:glycosyltransferase family 2 protein [Actinomycetota bacterium]